jgi:glycosyltransferase involved in cell wall biosynthesis
LINRARCSAKLLELLGAGIAVVGHDVGEMRQFVEHGSNGVLVAPDDADGFADAVIALYRDDERRAAMGGNAIVRARNECWDNRVPACRAAFRSATQQTRDR